MCYSDFGDIMEHIQAMDADVTLIEAARSRMELLETGSGPATRNDIGPGVYDIHSPRVPSVDEMVELLHEAARVLRPEQIWVNPDCGLKTRAWDEIEPEPAQHGRRRPSSCAKSSSPRPSAHASGRRPTLNVLDRWRAAS